MPVRVRDSIPDNTAVPISIHVLPTIEKLKDVVNIDILTVSRELKFKPIQNIDPPGHSRIGGQYFAHGVLLF